MAPSLAEAGAICEIAAEEAALLTSVAAPIVLMARRGDCPLPDGLVRSDKGGDTDQSRVVNELGHLGTAT